MSSQEYKMYMNSVLWTKKRNERIRIDKGKCAVCGSSHDLNVHHLTYRNFMHEDVDQDLITLCRPCHIMLHRIKDQSAEQYQEYKEEKNARIREARKLKLMKLLFRLIIVEIWQRGTLAGGDVQIFDSGKRMIGRLVQILVLIYPELHQDLWMMDDEIKDMIGIIRSALIIEAYRSGASLSEVARQYDMKVPNVQKILKKHGFNQSARFS